MVVKIPYESICTSVTSMLLSEHLFIQLFMILGSTLMLFLPTLLTSQKNASPRFEFPTWTDQFLLKNDVKKTQVFASLLKMTIVDRSIGRVKVRLKILLKNVQKYLFIFLPRQLLQWSMLERYEHHLFNTI